MNRTVTRRVDFVFVAPGADAGFAVVEGRVVSDGPQLVADGGHLWPSDHYGVLARLRLLPHAGAAAAASR